MIVTSLFDITTTFPQALRTEKPGSPQAQRSQRGVAATKFEIRKPKSETNPNDRKNQETR